MSALSTKTSKVLHHLYKFKSITPLESLTLYGYYRLSDLIFDHRKELAKEGKFEIITEPKGESGYAKYILKEIRL
jgi:hypothetical protein